MTIEFTKAVPDSLHHTCVIATWSGLHIGDDGQPVELANFADRTVQVFGDFGVGGSVRIEGSIDGANWSPLTDPQGNIMDIATPKLEAVAEVVRYIRPRVTGGDGTTNITVVMLLKGGSK